MIFTRYMCVKSKKYSKKRIKPVLFDFFFDLLVDSFWVLWYNNKIKLKSMYKFGT